MSVLVIIATIYKKHGICATIHPIFFEERDGWICWLILKTNRGFVLPPHRDILNGQLSCSGEAFLPIYFFYDVFPGCGLPD
jgi:hypothetical protein